MPSRCGRRRRRLPRVCGRWCGGGGGRWAARHGWLACVRLAAGAASSAASTACQFSGPLNAPGPSPHHHPRPRRRPALQVGTLDSGEIDYDELQGHLAANAARPAIININIGTTVKGAVDDLDRVLDILKARGAAWGLLAGRLLGLPAGTGLAGRGQRRGSFGRAQQGAALCRAARGRMGEARRPLLRMLLACRF